MSGVEDLETLFASLDVSPRFVARPDPVPGDLRMSWRLTAPTLALRHCHGKAATMQHLSLLVSAMRSPSLQQAILRSLAGGRRPDDHLLRFDPSITRTIRIAEALNLVEIRPNGAVKLAEEGDRVASIAMADAEAMVTEKDFLDRLPRKLTQKSLNAILGSS